MGLLRRLFVVMVATIGLVCPQAMAETVLTINYRVQTGIGDTTVGATTTLDSDGTISTEVDCCFGWADPDDTKLPDCLVPDPEWSGNKPKTIDLPGSFANEGKAKLRIAFEMASHIRQSWICSYENTMGGQVSPP